MISKPLLKRNFKSNYKLLLIFMGVLAMYISIMVSMFEPVDNNAMQELLEQKFQGMSKAFGFSIPDGTLLGFLSSYFYGFIIIIFPMIFDIVLANKLVARQVDKGSMSNLLATPNTRNKVSVTQLLFMILNVTILIAFNTILGIVCCESMFGGQLDISKFILLNLGALLLHLAISSICFFSSCVFNESRYSLSLGAGVPIAFFLIQMLANMGGKLENLKYATMFTLFNPTAIINGDSSVIPSLIALGVITVVLYSCGIIIFNKKDLPL